MQPFFLLYYYRYQRTVLWICHLRAELHFKSGSLAGICVAASSAMKNFWECFSAQRVFNHRLLRPLMRNISGKWVSRAFSMCLVLLYCPAFVTQEADSRPSDEGWLFLHCSENNVRKLNNVVSLYISCSHYSVDLAKYCISQLSFVWIFSLSFLLPKLNFQIFICHS
jgi:hypothetical protein